MKEFSLNNKVEFFETWEEAIKFVEDADPGECYTIHLFYSEIIGKWSVEFIYLPPLEKGCDQ